MFRQTGSENVALTRDYADHFSKLPACKGDRKRDSVRGKERIEFLGRLLEEGKFHDCDWATATLGGVLYRVNGGHSSLMLSRVVSEDGNHPLGINARILHFHCDTLEDLADLFDQFDRPESMRTQVEKIGAHKGAIDMLDSISSTTVSRCIAGVAWHMRDDGNSDALAQDEKIKLIHENVGFILWAKPYVSLRRLNSVGTVAAMYTCYGRNRALASCFWDLVKDESHESSMNASRILAVFLRGPAAFQKNKASKWSSRAVYAKCIHAANAWRMECTTALKYVEAAPLPRLKW